MNFSGCQKIILKWLSHQITTKLTSIYYYKLWQASLAEYTYHKNYIMTKKRIQEVNKNSIKTAAKI